MNEWLLRKLEASPDSQFYEWELRMHCPDFEEILGDGLLVRDLEAEESEFCFNRWGQHLHLERLDDVIFGVDTQNPESIVEVDPKELIQYRFNLARWQEMIRIASGLGGTASRLHKRLLFLGEKVEAGLNLGFILGFFTPDTARDQLLTLPDNMPSRYHAIVVTTPLSSPLLQSDIAKLEHLGVYVVPPLDRRTLMIECPRLPPVRPEVQSVALSPAQEADYDRYEYNCRLPIHLTGKITKAGNNEVLVGDTPVEVGDVPFLLFLRLLLELRRNKSGIVSKADLRSEGYFGEGTDDQSVNRLRNCFVRALGDLHPRDFIETYRRKTLRVSVHPDLVTWVAEKLSDHDDARVKEMVRQLIQSAEGNSPLPA